MRLHHLTHLIPSHHHMKSCFGLGLERKVAVSKAQRQGFLLQPLRAPKPLERVRRDEKISNQSGSLGGGRLFLIHRQYGRRLALWNRRPPLYLSRPLSTSKTKLPQRAAIDENLSIDSTRAVGFFPRNVADWSRSTTVGIAIASSRRDANYIKGRNDRKYHKKPTRNRTFKHS